MDRLVLWNIDLTPLDVGRVARDAYADAFRRVTGRPLAALPQLAGRTDTEIFFESLYLNDVPTGIDDAADTEMLARYFWALERASGMAPPPCSPPWMSPPARSPTPAMQSTGTRSSCAS